MDLNYSDADIAFRARARAWLQANAPAQSRPHDPIEGAKFDRAWQKTFYDAGWAGVNWPVRYGGLGLSGLQQVIWYEELARAKAPHHLNTTYIGLMHAGPSLIARGTEEQKAFHLPKILKGEAVWCQGFSEPNAGSDLASLRTRGRIDGDFLVVNGSKMWTTDAKDADYQELLVRTDPQSERHHGLTWIICDMRTPGIEIRPIRTMMQEEHVNAVFYDDVRIPLSNVVGEVGKGWSVALTTLALERGLGFIGDQLELYERIQRAIKLAEMITLDDGRKAIEDDAIAQRLAALKAEAMAVRSMTLVDISESEVNGVPGPKGSLTKLMVTTTHKALTDLVRELLGWKFLEFNGDRSAYPWTYEYLWSWVFTIAGGTSEIQREITADRILGLPRAR